MERRLTQLGELQVSVLRVLWRLGEATVHQVRAELQDDPLPAYTTVLTVLRSLEKRSLVGHTTRNGDRQYLFFPKTTEEEVRGAALMEVLEKHFGGDADQLVAELLAQGKVSPDVSDRILRMVDGIQQPR